MNQILVLELKHRLVLSVFVREVEFVEEEMDGAKTNSILLDGYICKAPVYRKTPENTVNLPYTLIYLRTLHTQYAFLSRFPISFLCTPCSGSFQAPGHALPLQIRNGTDSIIICGTTGESATMTEKEHIEVIKHTIDQLP